MEMLAVFPRKLVFRIDRALEKFLERQTLRPLEKIVLSI